MTHPHAWALEFGRDRLTLVRVVRSESGFRVGPCKEAPLADPQDGPASWDRAVRSLGVDGPLDPLVVCIADDLLLYRTLRLPPADDAALSRIIDAQAEALLPQPQAMEWAWGRLGDAASGRVLLCAMRRDLRRQMSDAARQLGGARAWVPSGLAVAANRAAQAAPVERLLLIEARPHHTVLSAISGGRVIACDLADAGHADAPADWSGRVARACQAMIDACPDQDRPQRAVLMAPAPGLSETLERAIHLPVQATSRSLEIALEDGVSSQDVAPPAAAAILHLNGGCPIVSLGPGGAAAASIKPPSLLHVLGTRSRLTAAASWLIAAVLLLYGLDVHRANSLEAAVRKLKAATAEGGGMESQLRLARYLEQTPVPPIPLLNELSARIPPMVIINQLEYDSTAQLRLQGTTMDSSAPDGLMQKLGESPLLRNVTLRSATSNPQTRQWTFEITAQAAPIFKYLAQKEAAPPPARSEPKPAAPTTPPAGAGSPPGSAQAASIASEVTR